MQILAEKFARGLTSLAKRRREARMRLRTSEWKDSVKPLAHRPQPRARFPREPIQARSFTAWRGLLDSEATLALRMKDHHACFAFAGRSHPSFLPGPGDRCGRRRRCGRSAGQRAFPRILRA